MYIDTYAGKYFDASTAAFIDNINVDTLYR